MTEAWEVWPDFDGEGNTGHFCLGPRECPVACTCGEGTEATAQLLAAAPRLLDSLKAIMGKIRDESGSIDPMYTFSFDADWEKLALAADAAVAAARL